MEMIAYLTESIHRKAAGPWTLDSNSALWNRSHHRVTRGFGPCEHGRGRGDPSRLQANISRTTLPPGTSDTGRLVLSRIIVSRS